MFATSTTVGYPKHSVHIGRLVGFVLLLAIILATGAFVTAAQTVAPTNPAVYRRQLESQVDTPSGAPVSGRDPAAQGQNSLAAVASMPSGVGQRVADPAANVVATHNHVMPSSVLPDPKSGVLASGCLANYGVPGAQCVPAHAPGNQPLTCAFINTLFPKGVKITGVDTLHLGQGKDTACGNAALSAGGVAGTGN